MANTIQIKRSAVAGTVPANLEPGELAVNLSDRRLLVGDAGSAVVVAAGGVMTGTDYPLNPKEGQIFFNTATARMYVYDGSSWVEVTAATSGGGTFSVFEFTATAGQVTFNGVDDNASTLIYEPGFVEVMVNGVRLGSADYTATDGTSVVLDVGTNAGDLVTIYAFALADVADTYTKAEADAQFLSVYSSMKNLLINGAMNIWQRGTSYTAATRTVNNDDAYLMDRWILLSDGNDVADVSRVDADDPGHCRYAAKFDVETSARHGILQVVEGINCERAKGETVTLSFRAKSESGGVTALRVAVLTWAGTEDAVTSDVVSAWDATPTWAANWTAENTPGDITITDQWATYTVTCDLDSDPINNIAVFIWTPNAETIGDLWFLTEVQLEIGSTKTLFEHKHPSQELMDCLRYAFIGIKNSAETGSYGYLTFRGYFAGAASAYHPIFLPVRMRTTPTASIVGTWSVSNSGQPTIDSVSVWGARLTMAITGGGLYLVYPSSDDTGITLIAEL